MAQSVSSLNNVTIGAASLVWGTNSLGHTLGGCKFTFDRKFTQLEVDKYGKTPVEMALNGTTLTIEATLAEPLIDFLAFAIPEAPSLGITHDKLGLGNDAGVGLRQYAKPLVLHPSARPASVLDDDIVIYLAVPTDKVEMDYQVDKQRTFKVTFTALVDETRGNGFRLGQIGQDPIS